jgi:hypothetical protein
MKMQEDKKKIGIICSLDAFSNRVRAIEIEKFLKRKGYRVILINSHYLNRLSHGLSGSASLKNKIPSLSIPCLIGIALRRLNLLFRNRLKQYFFIYQMKLRAKILERVIKREKFDAVICESGSDSYVLTKNLNCLKIYDCPTPGDELYYSGDLSNHIYLKFRRMELEIYKKTDYLSFYWESYKKYVQRYVYDGKNMFTLNWGCHPNPKEKRAEFANPLKIVFLGNLRRYWINLPLLARLTKLYKNIDVYGAPPPPKEYGLNYKGYAHPDILSEYQFGLITITKDRLRRWGFSAKHPEYLSYGLPVLVPDWRNNLHLLKGSIPFNEKNFLEKIKKYSDKRQWQKMSDLAYEQSQKYSWDEVLKPLGEIIDRHL